MNDTSSNGAGHADSRTTKLYDRRGQKVFTRGHGANPLLRQRDSSIIFALFPIPGAFRFLFRYTYLMQVNLSPHAQELLRSALARRPGRSPEEILEQLLDEQARRDAAEPSEPTDPVWGCLKRIPGIRLPAHWPPQYPEFEPIPIEGEPVSEQLIRERR